ncbi:hypothetical protein NHX12_027615 [Muraenolepis orangiensis]|uniref:E3 ubiquitin-protein ligase Arkadia N-terminal domain-containing protein n=1 Tax=Muraenolepis orangiensis TaxID=630683 RepID=A0A9Q0EHP6_9TELE|nr:hypothetical protein NHX12_027615 [Muraenolepis orangiensis]
MKMANSEKAEEFVDAESLTHCLDNTESAATTSVQEDQEEILKTETATTSSPSRDKELDSASQTEGEPGLLSMPCLMKELRRDSPESQQTSTGSDKPITSRVYESDSSNPCMLSPSSSGHLADSDTLSSGEEGARSRVLDQGEGNMETGADPEQTREGQTPAASAGGRKSRRMRSESEMPSSTMAAKKNRCQQTLAAVGGLPEKQTNGKLAKVKGQRSQKHKERMRLLRQKREAAARKKYNLLQDSSTSDSELTCDSSTSSSEDDDTSGGSKTINTDIPAGFRRAAERSRVGAQIHGLLDSSPWDRNIGSVLEEAMTRFAVMQRQTEERFRVWMEKLTRLDSDDDDDTSKRSSDAQEGGHRSRREGRRPSPPSSFLPSSESAETMAAYVLARDNGSLVPTPVNNNNNGPQMPEGVTQNGNLAVSDPAFFDS